MLNLDVDTYSFRVWFWEMEKYREARSFGCDRFELNEARLFHFSLLMQISIASLFRLFYFADFSLELFEIRQVDISIIYNEIMDKTAVTIGKNMFFAILRSWRNT